MIRRVFAALTLVALLGSIIEPVEAASPSPSPVPTPHKPDDLDLIKASGELRIAADPTAGQPYFAAGPNGPVGFEADMARAIAKRIGVTPNFVTTPWRDLTRTLGEGAADVVINAMEARDLPNIRFSKPYYVASQAILIRADKTGIYDLKDLSGKRVATIQGSVAQAILAGMKPAAKVDAAADAESPFRALASGQADAVFLEAAMVRAWLKKDPKRFKLVGRPVLPRPYAAAVRRGNPHLLQAIDAALVGMRKNGEHAKILQTYGLWDSLQAGAGKPPVTASPAPTPTTTRRRRRRRRAHH